MSHHTLPVCWLLHLADIAVVACRAVIIKSVTRFTADCVITAVACHAPASSINGLHSTAASQCVKPECTAAIRIAKMTPFRSFCVMVVTALMLIIMTLLQLKGSTITYVVVSLSLCMTFAVFCSCKMSVPSAGVDLQIVYILCTCQHTKRVLMCHRPSTLHQHLVSAATYCVLD